MTTTDPIIQEFLSGDLVTRQALAMDAANAGRSATCSVPRAWPSTAR